MLNISNDIVWHLDIKKRDEYLHKISSPEEISFCTLYQIRNSIAFLFSVKEAAYKVMLKQSLENAFAPAKWIIRTIKRSKKIKDNTYYYGEIIYKTKTLFFYTISNSEYTHSIASTEIINKKALFINIKHHPFLTHRNQTHAALEQLNTDIKKHLKHVEEIKVHKSENGIPYLMKQACPIPAEVSISHDGKYVATLIYLQ